MEESGGSSEHVKEVLALLHLGRFGMQRMRQLARTAVYWPNNDDDIEAAHADTAYLMLSIRIGHPNLQFTHGSYQRNPGVYTTSIMQSTSWAQTMC